MRIEKMQKCFNFFLKNQGTSGKNMQQILSLVLVAILGNDEDGGEGGGGGGNSGPDSSQQKKPVIDGCEEGRGEAA